MATASSTARAERNRFFSLSRITSSGTIIPEIDGLRFVAIVSVVAFHIYEYLRTRNGLPPSGNIGTLLSNGNRGVPLFFVISGFILGRPFAMRYLRQAPAPKMKRYFLRRLTRLEPPYLLAIVSVFIGLAAFSSNRGYGHLLASLIYSHNIIYGAPNPFFGLAWSLEIEVQFYCLIPLITFGLYQMSQKWRRVLLLALMFTGAFHLLAMPDRVSLSILGWIQCFAAGLLLADLYSAQWTKNKHWSFDVLSVILWPTVFLIGNSLFWIVAPSAALILYAAAFRSIIFNKIFNVPVISTIGGMCYTIYLVHYPVISTVGRMAKKPTVIALISLVAIAATSLVFFVFVERPCMSRKG